MKQQCEKFCLQRDINNITKLDLDAIDFLVDDAHKALLKPVQKTGCTSWRALFINNAPGKKFQLNSFAKSQYHTIGLGIMKEYSKEEALYRVKNYYSILTVRHPLRRLESWFTKNYMSYSCKEGSNISASKESMLAKFESIFLDYLSGKETDLHWRRIYTQSYPCRIHYRYEV